MGRVSHLTKKIDFRNPGEGFILKFFKWENPGEEKKGEGFSNYYTSLSGWQHDRVGGGYHAYRHVYVSTCNVFIQTRPLFPQVMQMLQTGLVGVCLTYCLNWGSSGQEQFPCL